MKSGYAEGDEEEGFEGLNPGEEGEEEEGEEEETKWDVSTVSKGKFGAGRGKWKWNDSGGVDAANGKGGRYVEAFSPQKTRTDGLANGEDRGASNDGRQLSIASSAKNKRQLSARTRQEANRGQDGFTSEDSKEF